MHNSAAQMARQIPLNTEKNERLKEIAAAFLRLGFTGFGGAAAHPARMEQEFVQGGKWVTRGGFVGWVVAERFAGRQASGKTVGAAFVQSGAAAASISLPSVVGVFLYFLKVGAVLFGSGYVLLAVLRADLVEHLHWLTENQLLDAIAVSQGTPGPFFTVATFVGYVIAGWKGAVLATAGTGLPAFAFVAVTAKYLPKLRKSPMAGAFLDGVNAAAVALMAFVGWQFARETMLSATPIVMAAVAAVLVMRFRVNSAWLVLGGALVGMGMRLLHLG